MSSSVSTGNFMYYGKSGDASMCQILPGAMVFSSGSLPIFCSYKDVSIFGMVAEDRAYLVMPGYKLEIFYDVSYSTLLATYDNRYGVYMQRYQGTGTSGTYGMRSVRIYYQDTVITDPTLS